MDTTLSRTRTLPACWTPPLWMEWSTAVCKGMQWPMCRDALLIFAMASTICWWHPAAALRRTAWATTTLDACPRRNRSIWRRCKTWVVLADCSSSSTVPSWLPHGLEPPRWASSLRATSSRRGWAARAAARINGSPGIASSWSPPGRLRWPLTYSSGWSWSRLCGMPIR